jgi:hypothetical protein
VFVGDGARVWFCVVDTSGGGRVYVIVESDECEGIEGGVYLRVGSYGNVHGGC